MVEIRRRFSVVYPEGIFFLKGAGFILVSLVEFKPSEKLLVTIFGKLKNKKRGHIM